MPWQAIGPLALACSATLAGCSAPASDRLSAADAVRWIRQACGLSLNAAPLLKEGRWRSSSGTQGWATWVDGIIVLPAAEVPDALHALREDRGLNLRGASDTRYSFQSPDGGAQERECELDTGTRQLYFRYVE